MILQGYALTDILFLLPTATSYMRRRDASKKKKKIIFLSDIGYISYLYGTKQHDPINTIYNINIRRYGDKSKER